MSAIQLADEFCPSCGEWVDSSAFNFDTGWCHACSGTLDQSPRCRCGVVLKDRTRTMCPTCRQERWYVLHADEVEYLVIVKQYSLETARQTVIRVTRPICHSCNKPIKGAGPGALFCKQTKTCHSKRNKFNRLLKRGLTPTQALAKLQG